MSVLALGHHAPAHHHVPAYRPPPGDRITGPRLILIDSISRSILSLSFFSISRTLVTLAAMRVHEANRKTATEHWSSRDLA
jgi:hypothetical protein